MPRFYSHFLSRKFSISCCTLHLENPQISSNSNHIEKPNSNFEQYSNYASASLSFNDRNGEVEKPTMSSSKDNDLKIEEIKNGGENGLMVEKNGKEGKMGIMVFLVGIWATMKKGFDRIWSSG